jgi:hypothetical protein
MNWIIELNTYSIDTSSIYLQFTFQLDGATTDLADSITQAHQVVHEVVKEINGDIGKLDVKAPKDNKVVENPFEPNKNNSFDGSYMFSMLHTFTLGAMTSSAAKLTSDLISTHAHILDESK